ncbi:MAG: hypothetical protein KIS62_07120 [Ramlibacter sp.]|nr:hypothetical protein [Ramlibacter sp.]MCW5649495.1 hypothetical protein [Ramlibacter sp.]
MLIQLITQHPQALGQIIGNTPRWVWGLLAALLWLGFSQVLPRSVGLRRVTVMPLAMTVFSAYGLATAFGASGWLTQTVGMWLLAAAAVLLLTWGRSAPAGTRYDAATRRFQMPGSWMPLALIVGIFLTKYIVGVELALQPTLVRDTAFALGIASLYGVFTGLFLARASRLWRLALRTRPSAPADAGQIPA